MNTLNKERLFNVATTAGWQAIKADPSLLCEMSNDYEEYLKARPKLAGDSLTKLFDALTKLPKFTDLATTSSLDTFQKYVDAHGFGISLASLLPKTRFGEIVRVLLKWKLGPTPELEDLAACGWPCTNVSFACGPSRTLNDVYRDMGVSIKEWIRNCCPVVTNPMSTRQWLESLTVLRVQGHNVLVHWNPGTGGNHIQIDPAGTVHVICEDHQERAQ